MLNEIQCITGYNRNYVTSVLNNSETAEALIFVKARAVKLKPVKPKPSNRTGKKIHTREVIASLQEFKVSKIHGTMEAWAGNYSRN
jgi:hypothetical protein